MVCKFCNSPSIAIKRDVRSPHNREYYHLYYCRSCKCHFFDAAQHAVSLKKLYDDISLSRGEFPEEFSPSKKWEKQKKIVEKLSRRPVESILDVGCRTGDFLMHFPQGIRREGVELSGHYAEVARKRGLTIYNDQLEKVDFRACYDLVSSFAILEHLEDPLVFLDKLSGILNPSGLLVVLIPAYNCLKRRLYDLTGRHWHMYSPPEHLNYYSGYFLDSYLKSKGFRLRKRYYTSGGMAGGITNISWLKKMFRISAELFDRNPLNVIPVFDHMYSYYEFGD
jgi:SAM-dependent methyltransferase